MREAKNARHKRTRLVALLQGRAAYGKLRGVGVHAGVSRADCETLGLPRARPRYAAQTRLINAMPSNGAGRCVDGQYAPSSSSSSSRAKEDKAALAAAAESDAEDGWKMASDDVGRMKMESQSPASREAEGGCCRGHARRSPQPCRRTRSSTRSPSRARRRAAPLRRRLCSELASATGDEAQAAGGGVFAPVRMRARRRAAAPEEAVAIKPRRRRRQQRRWKKNGRF